MLQMTQMSNLSIWDSANSWAVRPSLRTHLQLADTIGYAVFERPFRNRFDKRGMIFPEASDPFRRGRVDKCMEEQRMAQLTSRWYRDERDLERMLALVTASAMRDGLDAGHLHRGDVVWGLFQNLTIDPSSCIRLFEDGRGALRGFVWLHPPRQFDIHVNTAMPVSPVMVAELVRWAESHLEAGRMCLPEVPSSGVWLLPGLRSAGYHPTGSADYQLNARGLAAILEPTLPHGGVVRPVRVDDAEEVDARVNLHQEVWEPSKFTGEGYARLRTKPVYRPDLDFVAVTPDGELAAYCIVWWDPETRTGEFEPVGTSARFRRQGYGKALMLEALRRLRTLGAEHAIVVSATAETSEPARRLYASLGFGVAAQFERWEREAT